MNIKDFLEARIAEDEKQARALLRDLEGELAEEYADVIDERGPMTVKRLLGAQMWAQHAGQSKRRSFAKGQQIAYLANPSRVLAECEAKRAVIGWWTEGLIGYVRVDDELTNPLLPLAAVYADHPDYRQEWAINV